MIALHETTVRFPAAAPHAKTILDRLSLNVERGEWIALLGPNGSGKTTTLHTIAGLIEPLSGDVSLGAVNPPESQNQRTDTPGNLRPRLALLLQEPDNQFVTGSVRGELELSVPPGRKNEKDARGLIAAAAERFDLGRFLDRNPHCISGGEKQRLVLASVWLQDPHVLLLDEPTSYLDQDAAAKCFVFIRELHQRGVTIVWATPGGEELTLAQRIVCLGRGRVEFSGNIDELYRWAESSSFDYIPPAHKRLAVSLFAGLDPDERGGNVASHEDADGTSPVESGTGPADLARALSGLVSPSSGVKPGFRREIPGGAQRVGWTGGGAVVQCSSMSFGYDGTNVIHDVDLAVREGECLGITGPNGAGKSTLLDLAGTLREPTSGVLRRRYSRAVTGKSQNIFYLFQSPEKLFFAETVREEITFGLKSLGVANDRLERRVSEALVAVGLAPEVFLTRSPFCLSLGEMRRVALAIAAVLEPELLLLDEPTSCLDPAGRDVVAGLLLRRREEGGTTMIASHDTEFLAGVCDRIIWLSEGKIGAEVITRGEELANGAAWPEKPQLLILSLQDELAVLGRDVVPRALTPRKLRERLGVV